MGADNSSHVKSRVNRVVETLAGTPYLVNKAQSSVKLPNNTPFDIRDFNVRAAEGLMLERTHILFADEIVQHLTEGKDHCLETIVKTPRPVPFYDNIWIEGCPWKPAEIPENDFISVGGLVQLQKLYQSTETLAVVSEQMKQYKVLNADAEPYISVVMFIYASTINGEVFGPMSRTAYVLNADFEVLADESGPIGLYLSLSIPDRYSMKRGLIKDASVMTMAMVARVLGLMNCSNVEMVEEGKINDHAGRKRRERERLAWIKYHILKVRAGKHLIPIQPHREDGTGKGVALQTVRGHFKDFSNKGLFGKYKGSAYSTIWCPPFLKGNSEHGVVVKDYNLVPSN